MCGVLDIAEPKTTMVLVGIDALSSDRKVMNQVLPESTGSTSMYTPSNHFAVTNAVSDETSVLMFSWLFRSSGLGSSRIVRTFMVGCAV